MGVLLGLLAAVSYGASDFVAGAGGRRAHSGLVATVVQLVGLVPTGVAVLLFPGHGPTQATVVWGSLSGVGSGIGTVVLYRGLAHGRMSVVSPLSAVTTAVLPALVGLSTGDRLAAAALAGVALSVPAIALVSWSGRAQRIRVGDLTHGVGAGCGFALLFVALHEAGTGAGAWPLVYGQSVAVVVVAAAAVRTLLRSGGPPPWRPALRPGVQAGVVGGVATLLYLAATGTGQLTVVAVLTSLYPAVTVLLATTVLGEHMARHQVLGLAGTAAAVVLIAIT